MPSWGFYDPSIQCINYQWENADLSSFTNWHLNGTNVNWVVNTQNFGIQRGFLYRQDANVPSFAPVNNYHLVFNYRPTPMEWGPINSHYYNLSSTSLEEVFVAKYANGGTIFETYDYNTNNKKLLKFPFNYLDSFTDAFYSDSSGFDTLTATYVGYGNLSIPAYGALYNDVAKIKYSTGAGNFYIFWKETPWLVPVLVVDSLTNNFDLLVDSNLVSAIRNNEPLSVQLYPNPTKDRIAIKGYNTLMKVFLRDMYGRTLPIKLDEFGNVSLEGMASGVYFIEINTNERDSRQFKFLKL